MTRSASDAPIATGSAADFIPPRPTLPKLRAAAAGCRGCDLWKDATQTVQAPDAVLIDTTYLTQEEQVERIVALAKAVSHRSDET